jgi:hypothetical protein
MCEFLSVMLPALASITGGNVVAGLIFTAIQQFSAPSEHDRQVAQIRARGARVRAEVEQIKEAFTNTTTQKADELKKKRKTVSTNHHQE